MRESTVKNWLAALLIASHSLFIALCVLLYFLRGLLFEEMSTCLALLTPMFAVYTTTVVRDLVKNRHRTRSPSRKVSLGFAIVAFFFPCLFVIATATLLLAKAFNYGFSSFEDLKVTLALVQNAFGIYVGLIIGALLEGGSKKADSALK